VRAARNAGFTPEEVTEILTLTGRDAGFPDALNALAQVHAFGK
jgi:hypothetical protein